MHSWTCVIPVPECMSPTRNQQLQQWLLHSFCFCHFSLCQALCTSYTNTSGYVGLGSAVLSLGLNWACHDGSHVVTQYPIILFASCLFTVVHILVVILSCWEVYCVKFIFKVRFRYIIHMYICKKTNKQTNNLLACFEEFLFALSDGMLYIATWNQNKLSCL